MTAKTTEILVLGGGYAGVIAALRLAGKTKRQHTNVTLVNGLDTFVERPRLHEQATGISPQIRPLAHMLRGTKAQFEQGWVTHIDPVAQQVEIESSTGKRLQMYDYLVYALGSHVDRTSVPGVDEHAYTLDPWGRLATEELHAKLTSTAHPAQRVVVVGGGATGLEAAAQVKGVYPWLDVTLVTQGQAGSFKGPRVQAHIRRSLDDQAVHVREGQPVARVEHAGVILADGTRLPADLILWAGGFVAPPIARDAGIQVNSRNQILVDPYLRSPSHPAIFAVGDAAMAVEEPGAPMRMSLFVAVVSGAQAADNIVASLRARPLGPLSYAWYGQGIALGLHDAVGFSTYPSDQAVGPIFRRGLAVRMRNFFVRLLTASLEMERRFPGALLWNGRGRFARMQRRRQTLVESPSRG